MVPHPNYPRDAFLESDTQTGTMIGPKRNAVILEASPNADGSVPPVISSQKRVVDIAEKSLDLSSSVGGP